MHRNELIVVGGFLGSGKTTSILSLAKYFLNQGMKIGIVTNDQGSDLVDTNFLTSNGLSVFEVAGGCFCCHFNDFVSKIEEMTENDLPDIIIAEPIGSCINLIATLFKPLHVKFMDNIALRPLSVVVDLKRVKKLMNEEDYDFKTEVNYIFEKQLEEADIILLNKIDKIGKDEGDTLLKFLRDKYQGADVIPISAKNNINIDKWISMLNEIDYTSWKKIYVNYDIYSKAQSMLGWLHLSCTLTKEQEFNINEFILNVMNGIKHTSEKSNSSIAHLKMYGVSEKDWAKYSITSTSENIEQSKISECNNKKWNIIINIRSQSNPKNLKDNIENSFYNEVNKMNLNISNLNMECFKPEETQKNEIKHKVTKVQNISKMKNIL